MVCEGVPDGDNVDDVILDDGRRKQQMSASLSDEKSRNLDVRSRDKRACLKLQSKILLFERNSQSGNMTGDDADGDLAHGRGKGG